MRDYLYMNHLPLKLFGVALFLGIAFDILFFEAGGLGINVFFFQVLIILAGVGLAGHLKQTIETRTIVAAVFALLFSFTFVVWTSEIGLTMSGLGLFASNIFFGLFLLGHHGAFSHPIAIAAESMKRGAEALITRTGILSEIRIPYVHGRQTAALRGVLLAIPIVVIFGSLFLASDVILQQKVDNLDGWFDRIVAGDILAQLIIICVFTGCFLLFFAAAFWKRFTFETLAERVSQHHIETTIVLGSANVLFIAFLLFQAVYLFGGAAAWDAIEGITYSQYAVQGFNELAAVAVLVILLLLTLRYFHTERVAGNVTRVLEGTLLLQTIAVLISAWMRLSLYVEQYDFSPARLFGFWFFIVAATLLVLLFVHIAKRIPQEKYVNQALIFCAVAMFVFTMSAPDALAVRMNIARADDGVIDAFPLFHELSPEAFPVMRKVLTGTRVEYGLGEIDDYCEARPVYGRDGKLSYVDISPTDHEAAWLDNATRGSITNLLAQWRGDHYKNRNADGKGDSTPVLLHDWRSYNVSRARIPRTADGHVDINLNIRVFSTEEIAAACSIPLTGQNYDPGIE